MRFIGGPELAAGLTTLIALTLFVLVGAVPGWIARKRYHEHAGVIVVLGYIGLLTFGIFWVIALIWAFCEDNRPRQAGR